MSKELLEHPLPKELMKHAASSCGMLAELHGKQEAMRQGAEITLELPQPFTASAFCRAKIPPIVVRVAELCMIGDGDVSPDRVFEGKAVRSLHQAIKEGDTVIGMTGVTPNVLVVNVDNPEVVQYLHETYEDNNCMQHVVL